MLFRRMLANRYLESIKSFEGYTPKAAWDYAQHTNGYGTRALFPGEVVTPQEAERRFQAEIAQAAEFVDKFAPGLQEGVRAALTSLTYNAGTQWAKDGLGRAVAGGDLQAARDLLLQYNKAGGDVLPGLTSRRLAEAAWFGDAGTEAQPPVPAIAGDIAPAIPFRQEAAAPVTATHAAPAGVLASGAGLSDRARWAVLQAVLDASQRTSLFTVRRPDGRDGQVTG